MTSRVEKFEGGGRQSKYDGNREFELLLKVCAGKFSFCAPPHTYRLGWEQTYASPINVCRVGVTPSPTLAFMVYDYFMLIYTVRVACLAVRDLKCHSSSDIMTCDFFYPTRAKLKMFEICFCTIPNQRFANITYIADVLSIHRGMVISTYTLALTDPTYRRLRCLTY